MRLFLASPQRSLTHIEALELDEIPGHLLVVGGGYVGVDLSQAIHRFGASVGQVRRLGECPSSRMESTESSRAVSGCRPPRLESGRLARSAYRLFKVPMEVNLRARTLAETRGFLKALVEAHSDRILGFTACGGDSVPPIYLRPV